jgi:hypothetical protein
MRLRLTNPHLRTRDTAKNSRIWRANAPKALYQTAERLALFGMAVPGPDPEITRLSKWCRRKNVVFQNFKFPPASLSRDVDGPIKAGHDGAYAGWVNANGGWHWISG